MPDTLTVSLYDVSKGVQTDCALWSSVFAGLFSGQLDNGANQSGLGIKLGVSEM